MTLTVGIAGITGKVGSCIALDLLLRPSVIIHGYCRSPAKVDPSLFSTCPSRTHITEGDAFDVDKVAAFVQPCDVVVCAYLGDNTLMTDGQKILIDACEATHVPRYVAGDWSLDYTRLELGELPPKDPMKHIKAYLETKEHVRGVHVFNGVFMGVMFSPIFGAYDAPNRKYRYWGDGTEVLEATTYGSAAQYTAAMIMDPSVVGIQRILGDRKCAKEIVEIFEEVYGEKLTLERLGSLDDLKNVKDRARAEHPDGMHKWMGYFYVYHMLSGRTLVGPEVDNEKYTDMTPFTIKDFMQSRSLEQLATLYCHGP